MKAWWLLAALGGFAWGQGFFSGVQTHPALLQAKLGLEAAQASLRAQQSPIALQAQGGGSWFRVSPPPPNCPSPSPACANLPGSATSLSVGASLNLLAFGDVADNLTQASLAVEQARLGLRQTQTTLETQALEAAYRYLVAQRGLQAAQAGQVLDLASLEATRVRQSKNAATPAELRQSESTLRGANLQLDDAKRGLSLAQNNLREWGLSPEATPPMPKVPAPSPTPQMMQARFGVVQAQLAFARAERAAWPVLQGSYTHFLDANQSLSLSLDSRSLQPRVGYTYQDPARTSPQDRIEGEFRVGLSAAFSPALFDALQAGNRQLEAASAGLEAATRSAALQRLALESAYRSAELNLELAQQALQDARLALQETRERERLGLVSPLVTLQAELSLAQADLALAQANSGLVSRILDFYRLYALPLSPEVNP